MATAADFKGLVWLAHQLTMRTDLSEHQKVACIWGAFRSAPVALVRHALAEGEHDPDRCPSHLAPATVVEYYEDWRPGALTIDDPMRIAPGVRLHTGLDGRSVYSESVPEPKHPVPAINGLLNAAEHLLACLDELRVFEHAGRRERREYFRGRDHAAIVKNITAREVDLRNALDVFSAEQHEASEQARVAEERS